MNKYIISISAIFGFSLLTLSSCDAILAAAVEAADPLKHDYGDSVPLPHNEGSENVPVEISLDTWRFSSVAGVAASYYSFTLLGNGNVTFEFEGKTAESTLNAGFSDDGGDSWQQTTAALTGGTKLLKVWDSAERGTNFTMIVHYRAATAGSTGSSLYRTTAFELLIRNP